MSPEPNKPAMLTSGIPGLDTILCGGLFESGVYILEGEAGTGKTILANQVCFHQATQKRRAVYYTLLTESHDRMIRFLQGMSFFRASAVPEWITYVSGFKVLEAEGLGGVVRNVRDTIQARKASLLVIDGLVSAEEIAPNETAFKKFIHEIQTLSAMHRCTVILLTNVEAARHLQAEHTMVDGILRLESKVINLKPVRSIDVAKSRGVGQIRGTHTLAIGDAGIVVYPRIETVLRPRERAPAEQAPRRPFDCAKIDAMLHGGLLAGSNTMVLGPSGVGKTMLALHFACGGLSAGEKALFFTFYEQPRELLGKARRLGLEHLEGAVQRGDLRVAWQSSVEASLDRIGARLLEVVDAFEPARIVIDGIQGFQVTADPPDRIQDFFAALSDFFASRGATMLFTCENDELLGAKSIRTPFSNASRMCQNILLMRFVERRGRVMKVLSIMKSRDSDFDDSVRTIHFGKGGLLIGDLAVDLRRKVRSAGRAAAKE